MLRAGGVLVGLLGLLLAIGTGEAGAGTGAPDAEPELRALAELPRDRKLALVIGVNRYARLPKLDWAAADALAIRDLLQSRFQFDPGRILYLADDAADLPTSDNLRAAVSHIQESITPETVLAVFFAGHGLRRNREDLLLPSDEDGRDTSRCISGTQLMGMLEEKRPRRALIFFDACRNLAQGQGKIVPAGVAPLAPWAPVATGGDGTRGTRVARPMPGRPSGPFERGALFACGAGEYSHEDAGIKHGYFTHGLLRALEGDEAAADTLTGNTSFDSLSTYLAQEVARRVMAEKQGSQRPYGSASPGRMVLVRTGRARSLEARTLYYEGLDAFNRDELDVAEGRSRAALALQNDYGAPHLLLSRVLEKRGKLEAAIIAARDALRLSADLRAARTLIAQCYAGIARQQAQAMRFAEARDACLAALEHNPEVAGVRELLAETRARLRGTGGGDGCTPPAAAADDAAPEEAARLVREARRLLDRYKTAEAATAAGEAVEADPANPDAHLLLGRAQFRQGMLDAAVASLSRARELQPDRDEARRYLAGAQAALRRAGLEQTRNRIAALLAAGEFTAAERQAVALVAEDPTDAEAQFLLGESFLGLARVDDATAAYDRALRLKPNLVQARDQLDRARLRKRAEEAADLSARAAGALASGNSRLAGTLASESLALDAASAQTWLIAGQAALREDRPDDAVRGFQEALMRDGKLDAAVTGLTAALARLPEIGAGTPAERSAALVAVAAAHLEAGRLDAAEPRAREALARAPGTAPASLILATILERRGVLAGSLALFARVVESEPPGAARTRASEGVDRVRRQLLVREAAVLTEEAQGLLRRDEYLSATARLTRALASDPTAASARALLGYCAAKRGDLADAELLIRDARRQSPESAAVFLASGLLLHQRKKFRDARRELQRALAIEPDSMLGLNNLSAAAAEMQDFAEAEEAARKAAELADRQDPDYAYPWANLGSIRLARKKPAEALESYRRALALQPGHAVFHVLAARALYELKRRDEAREAALTALRLGVASDPIYDRLKLDRLPPGG